MTGYCFEYTGNRLPIVCWATDEREVCLNVNGTRRWFPVEFRDGIFNDPYCEVDGRTYRVGSTHAYRL